MKGRDFAKAHSRRNMAIRGHESVNGGMPLIGAPKIRKSKTELREEMTAAMRNAILFKTIQAECPCGHRARVKVPLEMQRPKLTCTKCGRSNDGQKK